MSFVRTETILDRILTRKVEEVARLMPVLAELRSLAESAPPPRDFAGALSRETVALIAEVKQASPSKGVLIADFDPVRIAQAYAANGAAAISVLTDEDFFMGHLDHLRAVRAAVELPVLRKDFVIDAAQVYEARAAGADAVLLIVMALEDSRLADLQVLARGLGMAALVEVHNEAELERALHIGATLIGVNNRDLRTFREDFGTTARVSAHLSGEEGVLLVAESAMRSPEDVAQMGLLGVNGVLVGEGLLRANDTAAQARAFSGHRRVVRQD
ncbi:MAG: indole-3-glycerol phosphate synthase TrpC [Anaerolineae bacterium]|nr:indole-3-glycerol phosphate synthase TrpC [Anaerolineae bacterium]NUQ02256.1 indole-3-glycerol phosphate synthase TrpC [Anaerolineae bacterium]